MPRAARRLATFAAALLLGAATAATALPRWDRARTVGEETVYPDHAEAGLWYYHPGPLQVARRDDAPAFRFDLFRYVGRKETRDAGAFRVRAVLQLEMERMPPHDRVESIRRGLGLSRVPALRPLPLDRFTTRLLYATVEAGEEGARGEVQGGRMSETVEGSEDAGAGEGVWHRRRYTVALRPLTAEAFWQGFAEDRLLLSLAHSRATRGVVWNGVEGRFDPTEKVWADSLPIRVRKGEHPELFVRHETWSTLSMAQTTLLVLCYDFVDEEPSDLHRVDVEVRFRTRRGQDYVERVRFQADDPTWEKEVSFRLARALDEPYQVRVTRVFRERPREQGEWQDHLSQQLDVSLTSTVEASDTEQGVDS